jgi:uncharacterized protein
MRFWGYAAVFDAVDRGGDVLRRGAFGSPRAVPLLWQHRGVPIGEAEVAEDARGLWVTARSERAVAPGDGLSVGYRVMASRQGAWRVLTRVELIEVSLVAQPMQRLARVERVFNTGD